MPETAPNNAASNPETCHFQNYLGSWPLLVIRHSGIHWAPAWLFLLYLYTHVSPTCCCEGTGFLWPSRQHGHEEEPTFVSTSLHNVFAPLLPDATLLHFQAS